MTADSCQRCQNILCGCRQFFNITFAKQNMTSRKLVNYIKNLNKKCHSNYWRYYSSLIKEELAVQTFSDIYVNVPYNVIIKPLDVHKYHNCDKLKIELRGIDNEHKSLKHLQDGNNIKIFAESQEYDQNVTCHIKAPVKANVNVITQGNISVGFFNGSKLSLKSTKGNIVVDKYHGEDIYLNTEVGDIVLKGPVIATTIQANILESGSIATNRLQGLSAELRTNRGNIHVDSSYCDNSIFETKSGNLKLQNVHKNSKIYNQGGNLNLSGLDGQLEAVLHGTNADIQISRILADSKITIKENGDLILRLSEDCQENTMFEIVTKRHIVDQTIKSICSHNDSTLYLMPTTNDYKRVKVECEKGFVHVQSASWMDMLKLNVKE